ncbi:HlyD family efflux transporter periplasmic adaptor subunit [Halarcobacter sp.]|uniref:HlyD family efflux transporter periplasmic adaptor subunit n=1 Tax=Halarcobacter sp. TaxID=2321133 RepID=UPI002AAB2AD2|nr:HlyD family efflux transporter periplasmic adaptor subunit [Halarcobacter sp.]
MKKITIYTLAIIIFIFFTGCFKKEETSKFYGNVDLRTVTLGFRVSGKIENLTLDEGQKVKKGQILATLNDDLYEQNYKAIQAQIKMQKAQIDKLENGYRQEEIAKAKASYDRSIVLLNKAKKDYERNKKLKETSSISDQIFDDYKFAYKEAKAQVDLAKSSYEQMKNGYLKQDIQMAYAKLETLQANLEEAAIHKEDTKLISPSDGTILTRAHEIGAIVDVGTPIFEIALTDEFWIRSYIDEKYLGLIQANMKAKVYTDSKPDKPYDARVSFISAQAEFTPKSVQTQELRTQLVYRVRLIIENPDKFIRQGMPVTIEYQDLD